MYLRLLAFVLSLVLVFVAFFVKVDSTHAQLPFGGTITAVQYAPACNYPPGYLVYYAPAPGSTPLSLYYITGVSFSYSYGPPAYPSQRILGKALVSPAPCMFQCGPIICYAGFGHPIMFHGTSL